MDRWRGALTNLAITGSYFHPGPQWKSCTDSADEDDLTEELLERPEQLAEDQVAAGKPRSSEQRGVCLSEPMDTCDAGSGGGGQRDVTEDGGNKGSGGGGQRDVTGNAGSTDEQLSRGDDQTNKRDQEEVKTESGGMAEGPVGHQWKQPNVVSVLCSS